jgi:hypothetical protein
VLGGDLIVKMKRGAISVKAWMITLLGVRVIFGLSVAEAAMTGAAWSSAPAQIDRKAEIAGILRTLETVPGVQKLPDKAKDKLSALNNGQLRLVYRLSLHMAHNAHTAAADIDFLLIAALIAFS